MDKVTEKKKKFNPVMLWAGLLLAIIVVNCIFVYLALNEVKTIKLMRNELSMLNQQKDIITAADDIENQYKDNIEVISNVFPNEETIPLFIQTLEGIIKESSESYSPIKFNSLTPIVEGDKLFLLMTISMTSDLTKISTFLTQVEAMPYMTHITGISAKTPGGFIGKGEIIIGMKVYVQNPFNAN
jgi:hypothetical protein